MTSAPSDQFVEPGPEPRRSAKSEPRCAFRWGGMANVTSYPSASHDAGAGSGDHTNYARARVKILDIPTPARCKFKMTSIIDPFCSATANKLEMQC